MRRHAVSRRKRQNGNSLVEFALSITLLVLLFSGAFQFGFAFNVFNQLEAAVRTGARYASTIKYDTPTATPSADFSNAVKNMVVYGTPTPSGTATPIVAGLTTAHVVVTPIFVGNVPHTMRVSISGYPLNTVWRTYTLTGIPVAEFPYLGVYAPA
jgi:Flp pilus assembly protein TadG